jgi:Arc/MetJ family transcription regulator
MSRTLKRTTVVLDKELVARAMKSSGAKTMHEALVRGLEELIRARARESLRSRLGAVDLTTDLPELLRRRHER